MELEEFDERRSDRALYTEFVEWKKNRETSDSLLSPRLVVTRPKPIFSLLDTLRESKWRLLVAGCFLAGLSILFAVIGTQTFWASRITWKGWVVSLQLVPFLSFPFFFYFSPRCSTLSS